MTELFDDADYWRGQADNAQKLADQMTDAAAKATMIDVAERYRRLAEKARMATEKRDAMG